MRVATFNVNGVRARIPVITRFLRQHEPDVLCLQETKVVDEDFPVEPFEKLGYECAICGQKSYNGVAIISRVPMKQVTTGLDDEPFDHTRLIRARVGGIHLINTYVPQGRDVETEHFRYKLDWLGRHDPKGMMNHPDFHPDARAALADVVAWGLTDVFRKHNDEDGQYSFYDYRNPRSVKHNSGWRVDLMHATRALANRCTAARIDIKPRTWKRPSDHTPVIAEFDL